MRILIVSDTHGKEYNLRKILNKLRPLDGMIHLGDSESTIEHMEKLAKCPVYMVSGNCDFFSELPGSSLVKIEQHRIMITHGHYYYVSLGTKDLAEEAKAHNCDIVMFGHTHRPLLDQSDPELTILNPGSLSYPRQEEKRPTYMLMTIHSDGKPDYELLYAD